MKTRIVLIAIIAVLAIQFTVAQVPAKKFITEEQKIAFATKNLLKALGTANIGVIESAMRITAQMKMQHPTADVSELVNVMNTVWQKHPSGSTRYKAYIAVSICRNPDWYASENTIVTANEENFFQAASARLQEELLSANTQ